MRKVILVTLMACAFGCSDDGDEHGEHGIHPEGEVAHGDTAEATFEPKSGNTTLAGTATFAGEAGKVEVTIALTGAPEGVHAVHIHETGDCSAADAMSAGGHWNPTMKMHGAGGDNAHLGDMGNLTVKADGTGTLELTNAHWEIGTGGPNDVVGKAVIVHAMADDFMTQPTGNAGGRIGCGVIE